MLLNDVQIRERAEQGMIAPFVPKLIREINLDEVTVVKAISYGLSSYGYDLRLSSHDFRVFRHVPGTVVDPKSFNPDNLVKADLHSDNSGDYFILPAHSYGLGVAMEHLQIPDNVTAVCVGKSTYARCGIVANVTPAEAAWKGYLTLEFSNSSSADCRMYANEGIVQLLFLEGDLCSTNYADRSGKYQNQSQLVTLARV